MSKAIGFILSNILKDREGETTHKLYLINKLLVVVYLLLGAFLVLMAEYLVFQKESSVKPLHSSE